MTIETLKYPNPRIRNSISVIKSKFLICLFDEHFARHFESHCRETTLYWQADCTTDFLGTIFLFKYSEFKGLELCKSVDIEIVCPCLVQKNIQYTGLRFL